MEINKLEIGKRVMRQRIELGLSQDEFSEQLGISRNHLSGIECGKYLVTTRFIFQLCKLSGKTPDYFLLGQVNSSTDMLCNLIRHLSPHEQELVIQLIETYLNSQRRFDL